MRKSKWVGIVLTLCGVAALVTPLCLMKAQATPASVGFMDNPRQRPSERVQCL